MAWSSLQSNSGTSASSNPAVAYTTNLTSGSVLIAAVSLSSSQAGDVALNAVATCADGSSNSLTYIGAVLQGASGYLGLFAATTPAGDVGTQPTITATVNGLIDNFGCSLLVQEISGISATPDGTFATGNGTASPATTGSYSSAVASEYLAVAYGDPGFSVTETTPSGYSADASNISNNGSANVSVFYKNSAGTSESASITLSGSANWMTLIVAFPLAGGAGTPGPPLPQRVMAGPPAVVVSGSGWRGANHSR